MGKILLQSHKTKSTTATTKHSNNINYYYSPTLTMGINHSTPVPTDADFKIAHKSLLNPLYQSKVPALEYSFLVPTNAWTHGTTIELFGLKVVPLKGNKRCVIKDAQGNALLVLQQAGHQHIQIMTFAKMGSTGKEEYDGKPLTLYANITEIEHYYKHNLRIAAGEDQGLGYKMQRCGSKMGGPKDVVVQTTKDNKVCAFLAEEPNKTWGCRVAPGIDPALLLALVVCSDRLRQMFDDAIYRKSEMMSYKISNVLN